jgi:hypothetical protein
LIPCLFVMIIFGLVLVIALRRRQRRLAYVTYPNRCVIVPANPPYACQNPCVVGEMPPPSYYNLSPTQKPYQGQSYQRPV